MRERLAAAAPWILTAVALVLLAGSLQHPGEPLSPQSLANRAFASSLDYGTAIEKLNRVWPPLYPSLLWVAKRAALPPDQVSWILFAAGLALLVPVGRRLAPEVHPGWWIGLYTAFSFHVPLLQQLVSETLLVPLALALVWALLEYRDRGRTRDLALVGVLLAACFLTRYFALVWLAPLSLLFVARAAPGTPVAKVVRAGSVVGLACLPVLAWMLHARLTTGFLTGMDRFAPRIFDAKTTLGGNLLFTGRTLFVDAFVPGRSGTHAAVGSDWTLDPTGVAVGVVAVALAAWCCIEARKTPPRSWLLLGLSVGYPLLLIAVWTAGNNDPIYTRFLYPSYVFFGLAAAHVYSCVKATGEPRARWPFRALYVWLAVAQLAGSLT